MKDISLEIIRLVNERRHAGPIHDKEMAEIEIITIVAKHLQEGLQGDHDTQEALVNMFLLGQVFQDRINRPKE